MKLSRRNFIQRSAVQMAGIASVPMILSATLPSKKDKKKVAPPVYKKDGVVLFQGDSITDAGRDRKNLNPNNGWALGPGYAMLAGASLLKKMPEEQLSVYNRGISGNKVFQLADRWQEDCIGLKPDILSILIGVNDYWHKRNGQYDGTIEIYEKDFRALLKRTKEQLPDVVLVIGEPYAVDGGSAIGEGWQEEFAPYRKVAKALSDEFGTYFIPYHSIYKEALKHAPCTYWSPDGVHPTLAGAQLMAKAWLKVMS